MAQPVEITRACVLGGGLLMGLASSAVMPGCILPDYCILLTTWGTDWCMYVDEAQMWPIGQPELAEPVSAEQGGPPIGCLCFNDGEFQILDDDDEVPAEQYDALVAELEENARNECAWAVPPGYDHTCYLEDGALVPVLSAPYVGESNTTASARVSTSSPRRSGRAAPIRIPGSATEKVGARPERKRPTRATPKLIPSLGSTLGS